MHMGKARPPIAQSPALDPIKCLGRPIEYLAVPKSRGKPGKPSGDRGGKAKGPESISPEAVAVDQSMNVCDVVISLDATSANVLRHALSQANFAGSPI